MQEGDKQDGGRGIPGIGQSGPGSMSEGDRAIKGGGGERREGVLEEKVGLRRGGFRVLGLGFLPI